MHDQLYKLVQKAPCQRQFPHPGNIFEPPTFIATIKELRLLHNSINLGPLNNNVKELKQRAVDSLQCLVSLEGTGAFWVIRAASTLTH